MAGKFVVNDKHRAFANAVASGEKKGASWLKYLGSKRVPKQVAAVRAATLLKRPEIQKLIKEASKARDEAIIKANVAQLPPELKTAMLTTEQLDSFHYSVVMGMVEVEEIHPVVTITKEGGKEISRTVAFHRVKRRANISERQKSVDALYKRFGNYAPSKLMGAFGNVNEEGDIENVQRFILLSNGERIQLP